MGFHTVAYSTTSLGTTANTDITAVSDQSMTVTNSHILPPRDLWVVGAYANSPTLSAARLNSNTLKVESASYIRPIERNTGALPASDPNFMFLGSRPLKIKALEELQVQATSAITSSTEAFIGLVWLADQLEHITITDDYWLRYTSSTAAASNKWTTISITLDQSLGSGTYAVVGMEHTSSTVQAARLIFDDQAFRPGCLGQSSISSRSHSCFYDGSFGVWGKFRNVTPPRVEVLCTGTDTNHEGYLRVVRIAAQ